MALHHRYGLLGTDLGADPAALAVGQLYAGDLVVLYKDAIVGAVDPAGHAVDAEGLVDDRYGGPPVSGVELLGVSGLYDTASDDHVLVSCHVYHFTRPPHRPS